MIKICKSKPYYQSNLEGALVNRSNKFFLNQVLKWMSIKCVILLNEHLVSEWSSTCNFQNEYLLQCSSVGMCCNKHWTCKSTLSNIDSDVGSCSMWNSISNSVAKGLWRDSFETRFVRASNKQNVEETAESPLMLNLRFHERFRKL